MGTGISPSVQQIRLEFMWKEEENMGIRTDYSNIHFKENGKLKLLIIVGTRPEIIRLAAVTGMVPMTCCALLFLSAGT